MRRPHPPYISTPWQESPPIGPKIGRYHRRGLGIGVGGAVGKAFAIVGGFFGFASAFFSFVGGLKSKGFYRVINLAGTVIGGFGAYLGIQYGLSE